MQQKPLHILFLASWYPSTANATLGNFIQRHAEAVALTHKVTVVGAFEAPHPTVEIHTEGNLTEVRAY